MNIKEIIKKISPNLYYKLAYIKMHFYMRNFKNNHANTKIFYWLFDRKFDRKLNSQYNQDFLIKNTFFKDVNEWFFCDIWWNHPVNINNTLYFEENWWDWIAFDPLPGMKKLWDEKRKAKLYQYAVSNKSWKETFTVVKNVTWWEDMLSFIKDTNKANYNYKTEDIEVEKIKLVDFFEKNNILDIDFMSIDVEWHELNVIKWIDFKKVNINVILIENNFGWVGAECFYWNDEIRKIMKNNWYIFWWRIVWLDDIFIKKDFIY